MPNSDSVMLSLWPKLNSLTRLDLAMFLLGFSLFVWVYYRLFIKPISLARRRLLSEWFGNLLVHCGFFSLLFVLIEIMKSFASHQLQTSPGVLPWVSIFLILEGAIILVKSSRIFLITNLFLGSRKEGVPLLFVNLFSLFMSIVLCVTAATKIFDLDLAPFLATSALISIILGLALQDTLGNLFAAVALQLDKPYEIDDWIEIQSAGQTFLGRVTEVTWRATALQAVTDETIVVPNRVMAQAHIMNFKTDARPMARVQTLRFGYDQDYAQIKSVLDEALNHGIPGVSLTPKPFSFIRDFQESYVLVRVVYFVDDFGQQYQIGDRVMQACLEALQAAGIAVGAPVLALQLPGVQVETQRQVIRGDDRGGNEFH